MKPHHWNRGVVGVVAAWLPFSLFISALKSHLCVAMVQSKMMFVFAHVCHVETLPYIMLRRLLTGGYCLSA